MHEIKVLSAMPNAQAHVVINHKTNKTSLVSYRTEVATIDSNGWLRIYGLVSATTRKHISAFMKEYTNRDYSTAKYLFERKKIMNLFTGETRKI